MIEINGKQYETVEFDEIDQNIYHGFIYVTVNKVNGMKYIGQHGKGEKREELDKNYIGSGTYIKRAINKYGRENFVRYIIELCKTQEELDERETYWINEGFGVNTAKSDNWYNIKDGAQHGGSCFVGLSEEDYINTCKKMSDNNAFKIPIVVLKNKKFYKEYPSKFEFAKEMGAKTSSDSISNCVKRLLSGWIPKKSSKWYGWEVFEKEEYEKLSYEDLEELRRKRIKDKEKRKQEHGKKISKKRKGRFTEGENPRARPIAIFKNGNLIGEFTNIKSAGQHLEEIIGGKLGNGIISLANGTWTPTKRSKLYGYSAKYLDER